MKRATLGVVLLAGCGAQSPSPSTASIPDASAPLEASAMGVDAALAPSEGGPNEAANGDAGVACGLDASGSLLDTMAAIDAAMRSGGGKGSNALQVPDAAARDAFAARVVRVLGGDEAAACALPPPYRLLRLVDPQAGALRVVAELDATGAAAPSLYWGTYAAPRMIPTPSRALAVEAPHPLFDTNTELEATALFLESASRYLLVAGAHRCADAASSGCTGTTDACGATGPYRVSDAAHTEALPFFAVHAALSQASTELVFLQLHGNAETCPDALMSDGSGQWSDTGPTGLLAARMAALGITLGKCGLGYPSGTCDLCGTDNVEARQTAGSAAACTIGGVSYGRLVHIEQQLGLRTTPGPSVLGYQPLIDAVKATFVAQ